MSSSLDRIDLTATAMTPSSALDIAGQAVRSFNHRTNTRFSDSRNGWNHVPDVYRCLGELTYLTGGLRQAIWHMTEAMQAQLETGHVGADSGSQYDGQPEAAIAAACGALSHARTALSRLYAELDLAQAAISRIHYSGPDLDGGNT
ncbi:hypothetical protein [uncultured Jatrophihabitans sp.]|uniref:hypothetical protein n=1 Tax=uncultured Jatrophihabitans sp. TaxID=1610747 RepID=UPI0035CBAB70